MARAGQLNIEGHQYEILYMKLEMHQTVDDAARPSSPVQWAHLYVELDWVDDEFLLSWVTANSQTYDFEIEQIGTQGKYKEIQFESAQCTELTERYALPHGVDVALNDRNQPQNFITCLFITAGTIKVDDVELKNF